MRGELPGVRKNGRRIVRGWKNRAGKCLGWLKWREGNLAGGLSGICKGHQSQQSCLCEVVIILVPIRKKQYILMTLLLIRILCPKYIDFIRLKMKEVITIEDHRGHVTFNVTDVRAFKYSNFKRYL